MDPWRRFKLQPWQPLLKVAAVTTVVAIAADGVLVWGISVELLRRSIALLLSPPLGAILPIAAAIGVGALGVFLCEQWHSVILNVGSLWALVLCLILGLMLKTVLPFPAMVLGLSSTTAVGVIVGVFWKGRPYWR